MKHQTANILYSIINQHWQLVKKVAMPDIVRTAISDDLNSMKKVIAKAVEDGKGKEAVS